MNPQSMDFMLIPLNFWQAAFSVFMSCWAFIGICCLILLFVVLLHRLLKRVLDVAVLIEAAAIARQQGKAPILRIWIQFWQREQDDKKR